MKTFAELKIGDIMGRLNYGKKTTVRFFKITKIDEVTSVCYPGSDKDPDKRALAIYLRAIDDYEEGYALIIKPCFNKTKTFKHGMSYVWYSEPDLCYGEAIKYLNDQIDDIDDQYQLF